LNGPAAAANEVPSAMPLFSFRTQNGERYGASDRCELTGADEAWQELTKVCGDLVAESCRKLEPNSEWSMELLDATDAPLFRIRLVAETMALPFVLVYLLPLISDSQPLI
jgi:hypothetical protein